MKNNENKKRLLYIDNIRLLLTILIVLHHVAVAYGGSGGWPLKETPSDSASPIIFLLFNGINQSFVLSLFFLLSGYFVIQSYNKKGSFKFLKDRFIRLGIPLLVYTILIAPIINFFILNFTQGKPASFIRLMTYWFKNPYWDIGPLWFLEALLIFSIIYVLFSFVFKKTDRPVIKTKKQSKFPSNLVLILAILILTLLTFLVRIIFPVSKITHVFQFGHFVHYTFAFFIGMVAYKRDWFENLTKKQAKTWKIVAILSIIALPVLLAISMLVLNIENIEVFLGGFSWQSYLFSTWETIAFFSIVISLLFIFKNKYNKQGKITKYMSPNFYTVYIIHQLIIVLIMIPFLTSSIPTYLKALVVAIIAIPACFVISNFIRKVPFAKRVLG